MAVTYYVAGSGSDRSSGTSTDSPFRTLQAAADRTQPGDTVYVMDGTYTHNNPFDNILTVRRSGTPDAWITYQAYPGHRPKLVSRNWHGICVQGASYIVIDGFELEGNNRHMTPEQAIAQQRDLNNPLTSGNGIGVHPSLDAKPVHSHHVVIRNNLVSGFGGGGIYTLRADYVTIEQNTVYGNALYAPYGCSGISLLQNWNSDAATGTKMVVRQNIVYGNQNLVPFHQMGRITDGNGIIVDDSRHTQLGSTLGQYRGQTLIEDNVVYRNGGRGIHVYLSDGVTIARNTVTQNCLSPAIREGEITAVASSRVQILGNRLEANPGGVGVGLIGAIDASTAANVLMQIAQGTEGADILLGTARTETLFGHGGSDQIQGSGGSDVLSGGSGDDLLVGGAGDDWLLGGGGSDRLWGRGGRDRFWLELNQGRDVIGDFNPAQDRLVLPAGVLPQQLALQPTRQGTLIQLGAEPIALLTGIRPHQITAESWVRATAPFA